MRTIMGPTLTLSLTREYFEDIREGRKLEEYRQTTPYWRKRIEGRAYENLVLTLGYPKRDDTTRRLVLPWKGYTVKTICHKHFRSELVEVFAIDVSPGPRIPSPELAPPVPEGATHAWVNSNRSVVWMRLTMTTDAAYWYRARSGAWVPDVHHVGFWLKHRDVLTRDEAMAILLEQEPRFPHVQALLT